MQNLKMRIDIMPTFKDIIDSIKNPQECYEARQKKIKEIEDITGRQLLVYTANVNKPESTLNLEDKIGFSDLIQDIQKSEVDFLINSPGGLVEITETIVGMIRSKFKNVRFAVPNLAKSAATLLVLSGDELLLDYRSELGPIDPQIKYSSIDGQKMEAAEDILDGFEEIKKELTEKGPAATPAYVPLLNKYTVALLRGCEKARELSRTLATHWLTKYMFCSEKDSEKPKKIADYFASRDKTLSHSRAILIDKCIELGLKVVDLRKSENTVLAKKLWELWCLYEFHFERASTVYKIYENSSGCFLQKSLRIRIPQNPVKPQQSITPPEK